MCYSLYYLYAGSAEKCLLEISESGLSLFKNNKGYFIPYADGLPPDGDYNDSPEVIIYTAYCDMKES